MKNTMGQEISRGIQAVVSCTQAAIDVDALRLSN
jgi:hypothetical protein